MTLTRKTPLRSSRRPIARTTEMTRGRIKPKKRTRAEFNRVYGSKERVAWIEAQACLACNAFSGFVGQATRGTCHNAHTVTGGTGRKAGYETIVPLCASHHRRYDEHQTPFDNPKARDAVKACAPVVNAAWLAYQQRTAAS